MISFLLVKHHCVEGFPDWGCGGDLCQIASVINPFVEFGLEAFVTFIVVFVLAHLVLSNKTVSLASNQEEG